MLKESPAAVYVRDMRPFIVIVSVRGSRHKLQSTMMVVPMRWATGTVGWRLCMQLN